MKVVSIVFICVITCLASTSNVWKIVNSSKPSSKSRFHVLHNWSADGGKGVYSLESADPFPAASISDVMLKTLGILRGGVSWNGVNLGNLFKRPKATALFLVDGLTDSLETSLSGEASFPVDQTGLTGYSVAEDSDVMFAGDNVLQHINDLFDGQSVTQLISGDVTLSKMLSPDDALDLLSDTLSSEDIYHIAVNNGFDPNCHVVTDFIKELSIIRSSINKISSSAVTDRVPDVYVFTFTSLKIMQDKYGADSVITRKALSMTEDLIRMVTNSLVEMYEGDIVIQALVIHWENKPLDRQQLDDIAMVLTKYLGNMQVDDMLKELPKLNLPEMDQYNRDTLCEELSTLVESHGYELQAECTKQTSTMRHTILKRDVEDYTFLAANKTNSSLYQFSSPKGIVDKRTDNYPAIFLIVFVTVVPLALSLFAISWTMWNMDPGRDSIIYRNSDNIPGINY